MLHVNFQHRALLTYDAYFCIRNLSDGGECHSNETMPSGAHDGQPVAEAPRLATLPLVLWPREPVVQEGRFRHAESCAT